MLYSHAKFKSNHLIHSIIFSAITSSEPGCIPVSVEKNTAHPEEVVQFLQSN